MSEPDDLVCQPSLAEVYCRNWWVCLDRITVLDTMLRLAFEKEDLPAAWQPEKFNAWLADLRKLAEGSTT